VLGRFADGTWDRVQRRIEGAVESGEVRPDVQASTLLELVAGATFVATATRPADRIGADWVEDVVDLIMHGIAPCPQ
jgi:hypothetical protein